MRASVIGAGFRVIRASGMDRLVAPLTRGLGAILMFHHVRPADAAAFSPNRLLAITPDFLDGVIGLLARQGFDIVTLDEAVERIETPSTRRPFAVLTFDDGYRDNAVYALPVLKRHGAPFTLFVTTGFADRSARLWWLELEDAVARARHISVDTGTERFDLPADSSAAKTAAFATLYKALRSGPEERLLATIARLAEQHGVDSAALVADQCLDWDGIAALAAEPLCTIGAHTVTHPMLAKHDAAAVRAELATSRTVIEQRLGRSVAHLAYPVGDPTSAGPREFATARDLGFRSAVTTRPGMIFGAHARHLTALPRLSVNGLWQDLGFLEALLSGAPFALWNRGRRLNVA